MKKGSIIAALWLTTVALTGCGPRRDGGSGQETGRSAIAGNMQAPGSAPHAAATAQLAPPTDVWIGRWTGPEGLYLDIQPSPDGRRGHYSITNRYTLDREGDYAGIAASRTIRFIREGRELTIRAGSGVDTGFKYLADRTDCLIVRPSREGYCR